MLFFRCNQSVCCCLQSRPFSPPVSGSPPPFAPLARAESSSSISSITLQSAASTPTLGKDLNMSTAGTRPASHLLISLFFFGLTSVCVHVVCRSSSCPCLTVLSLSMILSSSCLCSLRGLPASGMVWPRQVLFSFWRWVEPERYSSPTSAWTESTRPPFTRSPVHAHVHWASILLHIPSHVLLAHLESGF